jgi:hypothetical protein
MDVAAARGRDVVLVGYGAGLAAALAAAIDGTVRSVAFGDLRARLVADGAFIDMEQVA